MSNLLTPEEVATRLDVTPRTIQRWARDRKIGHYREGRTIWFEPHHIADFLRNREVRRTVPKIELAKNPDHRPMLEAVPALPTAL